MESVALGEIASCLFIPKTLVKVPPKTAAEALRTLPMALPVGGRMRQTIERLTSNGGPPRVTLACTSYLQAAEAVRSGLCAAVLQQTALFTLDPKSVHRLPIPDKFTLCLTWTARNAETRPALMQLISAFHQSLRA